MVGFQKLLCVLGERGARGEVHGLSYSICVSVVMSVGHILQEACRCVDNPSVVLSDTLVASLDNSSLYQVRRSSLMVLATFPYNREILGNTERLLPDRLLDTFFRSPCFSETEELFALQQSVATLIVQGGKRNTWSLVSALVILLKKPPLHPGGGYKEENRGGDAAPTLRNTAGSTAVNKGLSSSALYQRRFRHQSGNSFATEIGHPALQRTDRTETVKEILQVLIQRIPDLSCGWDDDDVSLGEGELEGLLWAPQSRCSTRNSDHLMGVANVIMTRSEFVFFMKILLDLDNRRRFSQLNHTTMGTSWSSLGTILTPVQSESLLNGLKSIYVFQHADRLAQSPRSLFYDEWEILIRALVSTHAPFAEFGRDVWDRLAASYAAAGTHPFMDGLDEHERQRAYTLLISSTYFRTKETRKVSVVSALLPWLRDNMGDSESSFSMLSQLSVDNRCRLLYILRSGLEDAVWEVADAQVRTPDVGKSTTGVTSDGATDISQKLEQAIQALLASFENENLRLVCNDEQRRCRSETVMQVTVEKLLSSLSLAVVAQQRSSGWDSLPKAKQRRVVGVVDQLTVFLSPDGGDEVESSRRLQLLTHGGGFRNLMRVTRGLPLEDGGSVIGLYSSIFRALAVVAAQPDKGVRIHQMLLSALRAIVQEWQSRIQFLDNENSSKEAFRTAVTGFLRGCLMHESCLHSSPPLNDVLPPSDVTDGVGSELEIQGDAGVSKDKGTMEADMLPGSELDEVVAAKALTTAIILEIPTTTITSHKSTEAIMTEYLKNVCQATTVHPGMAISVISTVVNFCQMSFLTPELVRLVVKAIRHTCTESVLKDMNWMSRSKMLRFIFVVYTTQEGRLASSKESRDVCQQCLYLASRLALERLAYRNATDHVASGRHRRAAANEDELYGRFRCAEHLWALATHVATKPVRGAPIDKFLSIMQHFVRHNFSLYWEKTPSMRTAHDRGEGSEGISSARMVDSLERELLLQYKSNTSGERSSLTRTISDRRPDSVVDLNLSLLRFAMMFQGIVKHVRTEDRATRTSKNRRYVELVTTFSSVLTQLQRYVLPSLWFSVHRECVNVPTLLQPVILFPLIFRELLQTSLEAVLRYARRNGNYGQWALQRNCLDGPRQLLDLRALCWIFTFGNYVRDVALRQYLLELLCMEVDKIPPLSIAAPTDTLTTDRDLRSAQIDTAVAQRSTLDTRSIADLLLSFRRGDILYS